MIFRLVERLFVMVLLLDSMHVILGLTSSSPPDASVLSGELHMSSIMSEAALCACGIMLALLRWRRMLGAMQSVWPVLGLTALASLSIAWSAQPDVTLRRSTLLVLSTLLAIYIGERYTLKQLARLLAQALCFMIVAVILLYFVSPAHVVDYSDGAGAWMGLSMYKNSFGEYMAVAVVLLLLVRFSRFDWLRYPFLIAAAALLVLSHSASSLVCCVVTIAAMPLWSWARLKRTQRLLVYAASAGIFLPGIYFIARHAGLLLQALGRNSTLTGRMQLWAALWPAILSHPILGYGYDTFWVGWKGEVLNVRIASGWPVLVADNGYLDLCLSIGLLGLAVFLCVWAHVLRRAVEYIRLTPAALGLWPVSYLCFFTLHNLAESTLLTRGAFSSLMFVAIATSLAVNRRRVITAQPCETARSGERWQVSCALTPGLAPTQSFR